MISGLLILVFSLPSFASTSALLLTATKTPVESGFMLNNSKSASASLFSFFWLISLGDASIEKLTKEAGFTRVHHIDKETRSFLFLFQEEKTTVYGE
tara:strand:+ start:209 stop:499 length:291 start_codon:yes stop_codon:yes gene_type:complete